MSGFRDQEVDRFLWHPVYAYTPDDARAFLNGTEPARQDGRALRLAIAAAASPERAVGGIWLSDFAGGAASLGYWLAAATRGRGAATRATRLLATWALESLELDRVVIDCLEDNLPSQLVAQRAGFRHEGVAEGRLEHKGTLRSVVRYVLDRGMADPRQWR